MAGNKCGWNSAAATKQIELTSDQVEEILESPLPKPTTKLNTWWTDVQPKIQRPSTHVVATEAIPSHGWLVAEFNLSARRVKSVRV